MKKQLLFVLMLATTGLGAMAQSKPKTKTQVKPQPKTQAKAQSQTQPKPQPKPQSKVQAKASAKAFGEGDNLLNVGVGIGSPFFGAGYSSSLPINPSISYERGITNEISVGGQVAYASSKYSYNYPGANYNFKENAIYIGARGSYHFNELLDLDPKFDVYGGASIGYVIVNVSDNLGYSGATGSGVGFGLFAGGKYYFSNSTGVFAEVGYQSLAVLNVGVAFRF